MFELAFIGGLGLVMGFVTAVSGGAGVFGVPAMLAMGLPPINVLALNRMSDVGVVIGALRNYHRSKNIDWRLAILAAVPLGIGSFIGANVVLSLDENMLKYVILAGVFVGIVFLLKSMKEQALHPGHVRKAFGVVALILVGLWSGALAMAGATFAVLVLVYFFGKNFLQARSTDVVAAIPETIISTTILALGSTASFEQLGTMFGASFVGAWIGSHMAVKHGDRFIRTAMVVIAIVMASKVVVDL